MMDDRKSPESRIWWWAPVQVPSWVREEGRVGKEVGSKTHCLEGKIQQKPDLKRTGKKNDCLGEKSMDHWTKEVMSRVELLVNVEESGSVTVEKHKW